MDACYIFTMEVNGKINSIKLFKSRSTADGYMTQKYFEMKKNIDYMFSSIDSTNAIIVSENIYVRWHIEEMQII